MPPWHIDKTVGIQRFQERSQSHATSRSRRSCKWVDGGTPQGRSGGHAAGAQVPRSDALAARRSSSDSSPTSSLKSPAVHARGARRRTNGSGRSTETGLTEPRWVRAIEIRPASAERPQDRAPRAHAARAARGRRHHQSREHARTSISNRAPDSSWSGRSARPARSFRPTPAS